jgi:hypothetical protein
MTWCRRVAALGTRHGIASLYRAEASNSVAGALGRIQGMGWVAAYRSILPNWLNWAI